MNLGRVTSLIKARVMSRDSLVTSSWLTSKPHPPLACSLKRIHALPDKLKLTATAYRKCNIRGLARYWPHMVATRLNFLDILKYIIILLKDGLLDLYEVIKH